MNPLRALARRLAGDPVPPIPVRARHAEYSAIVSADDDPARPSDRLLDLALRAAQRARSVSMAEVVARMKRPPYYPDIWPGEHYKLLAGLVMELRPALVVEIGTATGLSALAMRHALAPGARLVTFDIVPWPQFAETCLRPEDFSGGTLAQILDDVGRPQVMERHAALFRGADVIFVDGPKDGVFEARLLENLGRIGLPKQPLLVFDDIRVWNMLETWRSIGQPKLDVTSFGHWSGTGLVDWVTA